MTGIVERAVRAAIAPGRQLATAGQAAPFVVAKVDEEGIVLLLGATRAYTPLRWECLEGVVGFLHDRGWVRIGGKYDVGSEPDTLDAYLKTCINRATAGGWPSCWPKQVSSNSTAAGPSASDSSGQGIDARVSKAPRGREPSESGGMT